MNGFIRDTPQGAVLAVRVTPRASRSAFQGVMEKQGEVMMRVALHAPPIEGRANEELLSFLARQLDVPVSALEIVRGLQSREKLVRTIGMSADELTLRLQRWMPAAIPS